jgi:hypothetical protein
MLADGANPFISNMNNVTAMDLAVSSGQLEAIRSFESKAAFVIDVEYKVSTYIERIDWTHMRVTCSLFKCYFTPFALTPR